jgi:hypothetical protein
LINAVSVRTGGAALTGFAGALLGRRAGVWAAGGGPPRHPGDRDATVAWLYVGFETANVDF